MVIVAILLAAVFTGLAFVHVLWACGSRWALSAAVPANEDGPLFEPGPVSCLLVAGALLLAALVTVSPIVQPVLLPESESLLVYARWAMCLLAVLFFLRGIGDRRYVGVFKRVRDTRFAYWDTVLFTPLCFLLAVLAACLTWQWSGIV